VAVVIIGLNGKLLFDFASELARKAG